MVRLGAVHVPKISAVLMNAQAILHDLDWRFLLPRPPGSRFKHLVLLGATDDHATMLLELGVAERVSTELPARRVADGVAVLGNVAVDLRAVAASLVENGVYYQQVDYRLVGKFSRLRQTTQAAMRSAGLSLVATYWMTSQAYLPSSSPSALRWYLTTLHPIATLRGQARVVALRTLLAAGTGVVQRFIPRVAIIARAGTAADARPSVLDYVALPGSSCPPPIFPIMLSDFGDRVVILPFRRRDRQPSCIVKIPKREEFNDRTLNEQRVLADIRQLVRPELRTSIPDPLDICQAGTISIAVQNYLSGRPLLHSTRGTTARVDRKVNDLRLATDWLIAFHTDARIGERSWGEEDIRRWVDLPFQQYAELLGPSAQVDRLHRGAREYAEVLVGCSFPEVWQHRDYNVWNILRSGARLGVIDWDGGRIGLPLCDLLHFTIHWHEAARGLATEEERRDWFRRVFLHGYSGDVLSRAVHENIGRYMIGIGLDTAFLPLFLVYLWIELALRRAYQVRDAGDEGDAVRLRNRNIVFVEMLARHVDTLLENRMVVR